MSERVVEDILSDIAGRKRAGKALQGHFGQGCMRLSLERRYETSGVVPWLYPSTCLI
jgi:hypothetical protein